MNLQKIISDKCIEKYITAINSDDITDPLPECIIIYYTLGKREKNEYKVTEIISAERYSDGSYIKIFADTIPDTSSARGAFFKQAFAEYGYDENSGKAFINIYFGKRFAAGYEYDIHYNNDEIKIINEEKLWIS